MTTYLKHLTWIKIAEQTGVVATSQYTKLQYGVELKLSSYFDQVGDSKGDVVRMYDRGILYKRIKDR